MHGCTGWDNNVANAIFVVHIGISYSIHLLLKEVKDVAKVVVLQPESLLKVEQNVFETIPPSKMSDP